MKLQIFYSSESGSLGNAQRIQQEVNTYLSDGKINSSISSSLEENEDYLLKVVLNGDCTIWHNELVENLDFQYPLEGAIGLHLEIRNKYNYYKHCR